MRLLLIKFLVYNRILSIKKKSSSLNFFLWQQASKKVKTLKINCWVNKNSKRAYTSKLNLSRYNFKHLQSLGFLPFFKK